MRAEEWRAVLGYEGRYEVSDLGNVRSIRGSHGPRKVPRPVKAFTVPEGYAQVSLRRNRTFKSRRVHTLVAAAFIREPREGEVVRHLDGDPSNNRVSNLAVGTHKENCADKERHGRTAKGERNGFAKLSADSVRRIRDLYASGALQTELAKKFVLGQTHVSRIIRRETWKHL